MHKYTAAAIAVGMLFASLGMSAMFPAGHISTAATYTTMHTLASIR